MTLPGFGAAPHRSTTPTTNSSLITRTGVPPKNRDAGLGRPHGYPWCHPKREKGLGQDWGGGLHSCRALCQEGPRSEEANPKAPGG